MRIRYRVRQVLSHLRANRSAHPALPAEAMSLLNEPMLHQFRTLQPGDQRHLLNVYHFLIDRGAQPDTVTAGLIHDVGKGCMKCRITVLDRTAHVLLSRFLPGPYRAFAGRDDAPERLRGLHRLASHPRRGAIAAQQAGYNERICDLILHHEQGGDSADEELMLLRRADDEADALYGWGGRS